MNGVVPSQLKDGGQLPAHVTYFTPGSVGCPHRGRRSKACSRGESGRTSHITSNRLAVTDTNSAALPSIDIAGRDGILTAPRPRPPEPRSAFDTRGIGRLGARRSALGEVRAFQGICGRPLANSFCLSKQILGSLSGLWFSWVGLQCGNSVIGEASAEGGPAARSWAWRPRFPGFLVPRTCSFGTRCCPIP